MTDEAAPRWVDTHCHLQLAGPPVPPLVERAGRAGVEWLVCPGVDEASSAAARLLATGESTLPILWTAGLHPHDARNWPAERDRIAALAAGAAAVGECGLDFYRDLSPRSDQRAAFEDQVALAAQLDKPLIVHCRDAFEAVYEVLERAGAAERAVLHCWTGGPRWTKRFRELGATFSYAGPIAFATGDTVRRGAAEAPPDRTMVETDTPYLSPPPHRGEPNEPARVALVGEALARVWGIPVDEVARRTSSTAARVFGRG